MRSPSIDLLVLPDWVRLVPVELPGRGARIGEPYLEDCAQLVARISDEHADAMQGRYVLFGHPMQDELPLIEWTRLLLRAHRQSVLAAYRDVSAEELVRIFLVDCCLAEATRASVRPLPALAAGAQCCWANDRREAAVTQINEQLSPAM